MDDRTRVLICLGAARAAGCEPCLAHFLGRAHEISLNSEEIQAALDLGRQMRQGAELSMRRAIREMIPGGDPEEAPGGLPCC